MYKALGWCFPDIDQHFLKHVDQFPIANYQQTTIDAAYRHVKKFDCVIDVGANIGLFSVRFSKEFNQVISFEPTSINFECLQENISTLNNIKTYKLGLGEVESTEIISLPAESNNCGAFSIIDFNNHPGDVLTETVTINTLDSYNLKPDLIKIDVQGFDLNVLKGSINTINTYKPIIISEIENIKKRYEFFDFFESVDYELAESIKRDYIWRPK
jgi:FkbM family methyltransferase